jgi:hypothetical protein
MVFLLVLLNCLAFSNRVSAVTSYQLHSPDNRIQVTIRVDERITYDVTVNGKLLRRSKAEPMQIALSDYKKTVQTIDSKLKIHMMGGGGWAPRFVPSATQ